jgi:pimeloyl-ACP methyl ester carboxylesterase
MDEWWFRRGPRALPLRVCEWGGDRGGTPVVVLHGFLEQGAAWDAVAGRLGRRVVAPDQRGHGRSGHVGTGAGYPFWDYVGDLDGLVEHLGGVVDLVGHSMGGTVAALFAGARPESVRRLVLVEGLGPPDATAEAVERGRAFLASLRDPPRHGAVASVDEAAERIRRGVPSLSIAEARALAERTLRSEDGGFRWTWDASHRGRSPVPFQTVLFGAFLTEIRCPVLLIDGENSMFRIKPDLAERRAKVPHAVHVGIPGAGHLVHHDAPEALAAAITSFLEAR